MLIKNDGAHDGRSGVGDVPRATTTPELIHGRTNFKNRADTDR
jgi:hypothetical protein